MKILVSKIIAISLISIGSSQFAFSSNAEPKEVTCSFTEPFITVKIKNFGTYQRVTATTFESEKEMQVFTYNSNLQSILVHYGYFNQMSDMDMFSRLVLHTLKIDRTTKGSDGMSDLIYPYHADLSFDGMTLEGGCETDTLKAVCPVGGGC